MRRSLNRGLAVTALLAVSSSWAGAWSSAFHVATEHHHDGDSPDHDGALGLQMVLHGHAHADGTPAHRHPVVASVAVPVPGKLLMWVSVMIGDAPEGVRGEISGRRLLAQRGRTHDPPPCPEAFSVLRI